MTPTEAQCRVSTNLQFEEEGKKKKNPRSVKHNKAKQNKMRYACIYPWDSLIFLNVSI